MADSMAFEWTIRFGDILTVGGALFVGFGILLRRTRSDADLSNAVKTALMEISEIKAELKEFARSMGQIAIQEVRINLLMKWYDELRRGKGRIVEDDEDH